MNSYKFIKMEQIFLKRSLQIVLLRIGRKGIWGEENCDIMNIKWSKRENLWQIDLVLLKILTPLSNPN